MNWIYFQQTELDIMKTTKEIIRDFKDIKEDYVFDPDIMNMEDERVHKVKEIINTKLSLVDKTLILLYVDCLSLRKLGERLGLSHMTCRKEIIRIKNIILSEYQKMLWEIYVCVVGTTRMESVLQPKESIVE